MLDVLDGEKLDFPIAYDWEDFLGFEDYKMNLQDINDCFEVFADEVEAAGYEACLYSSLNFLETVWTNTRNHKVWLAHYTSQTDYTGSYYMWQHTSSGKIDGVNCAVDFNVLYE
jgi:GH25 family lysozyme M1 (1,4-beta-N-acetylmuramidase)